MLFSRQFHSAQRRMQGARARGGQFRRRAQAQTATGSDVAGQVVIHQHPHPRDRTRPAFCAHVLLARQSPEGQIFEHLPRTSSGSAATSTSRDQQPSPRPLHPEPHAPDCWRTCLLSSSKPCASRPRDYTPEPVPRGSYARNAYLLHLLSRTSLCRARLTQRPGTLALLQNNRRNKHVALRRH